MADLSSWPWNMSSQFAVSSAAEIYPFGRQRPTGRQFAERVSLSKRTVHRIWAHHRLHNLNAIEPPAAPTGYEHDAQVLNRTWTSSAWVVLAACAIASVATVTAAITVSAGSSSTSPVAINPVWLSRISWSERHPSATAFLLAAVGY